MDNKQILYGIDLDNYWEPERVRGKRGYIGTKEDLEEFARLLDLYWRDDTEKRTVSETIREYFSEGSAEDPEKQKRLDIFRTEVVYRSGQITLMDHQWQYRAANDAMYPMYAKCVNVERIIVYAGGYLFAAIKGTMEGLRVCLQGTGWVKVCGCMNGHPETIIYNREDEVYEMRLFAVVGASSQSEMDEMIQKWNTNDEINLTALCADIIAEGKAMMAPLKYCPK